MVQSQGERKELYRQVALAHLDIDVLVKAVHLIQQLQKDSLHLPVSCTAKHSRSENNCQPSCFCFNKDVISELEHILK